MPLFLRLRAAAALMVLVFTFLLLEEAEGKAKKPKKKPSNETSMFNFLRLFLMRLVYGFASMIGADEAFEDFLGGAFVPPGAEESDYRDYLDDDKDYEYY